MRKIIYSAVAIIAIAGIAYGIADHQAYKIVKKGLDQWIQTQTHKSDSQITAINYQKINTNGFFFFTHHASIENIKIVFKPLNLQATTDKPINKVHSKTHSNLSSSNDLLQLPDLKIKTLSFTANKHAIHSANLSGVSLSSQNTQIKKNLDQLNAALGGQPVGSAHYNYQSNTQAETLNVNIKVKGHAIFNLNEQGQDVPKQYTLPHSWARSFKNTDNSSNFIHAFQKIHQELIKNTGNYKTTLSLNLPKLQLPANVITTLKQLGYHNNEPLTLKLDSTIHSKQEITTIHLAGFAKLPKAASTHFNNSLHINNQKIAKELGELLAQTPKNQNNKQQQQALAMHFLAIEGRNIFLDNLEFSYKDNSLLPKIYQENAKHMHTGTGLPSTAQDVATLYAAIIQSAQINPALIPYQTTLAQFFQDPKELKLAIKPEKPLSLFEIFFFAMHKQDAELIHALNAKLTNHA